MTAAKRRFGGAPPVATCNSGQHSLNEPARGFLFAAVAVPQFTFRLAPLRLSSSATAEAARPAKVWWAADIEQEALPGRPPLSSFAVQTSDVPGHCLLSLLISHVTTLFFCRALIQRVTGDKGK